VFYADPAVDEGEDAVVCGLVVAEDCFAGVVDGGF
jgi:hypothetical protein